MWNDFLTIMKDIFLWIPRYLYSLVQEIIEFFMSFMPTTPLNVQGALDSWSGDIMYFMTLFRIDYAITVLFSVLIARFILRRIPFIG